VDMWEPFIRAVEKEVPDADIVHDKFHVSKYLGEAVDKVRRQEHKQLMAQGDKTLKGTRQLWLYNPQNFSAEQAEEFCTLKDLQLKVARAWAAKELFSKFWAYQEEGWARRFFKDWFGWVSRSRLKPMVQVAQMLKRHLDNLLTYLKHRITNAVTEGLNSKSRASKPRPEASATSATTGFASCSSAESSISTHYDPRRNKCLELLADGFQFLPTFRSGFRIGHLKFIERIKDNAGNNQPGILLIIGGNDIPGRVMGAGRGQARLISLHSGSPWREENLRMHPDDQHLLIIGTIEDADPPAFGQTARRAPKKIMFQFFGARLFETENLAALRIDAGHDVPDGAVLAGSVHPLKNQQQRIAVGCVVKALQRAQLLNVFFQEFLIRFFDLQKGFTDSSATP
jgi:phosphopantetheinyl transferase (holo-ACP synthase)